MNRWARYVLLCVACAVTAVAQNGISVGYLKKIEITVTGATAAYSMDSLIVEATAADGVVQIEGRAPGTTNIIVVTPAGVQTLSVSVPQPPPQYPPGFEPPSSEQGAERGAYEVRYNSSPSQLTNSIDFTRTLGSSFDRIQITTATLLSNTSQGVFGIPLASYEINRPTRDVTFVDKQVNETPLTLDGYLVRGLHVQEGPWQFHGGFTSVAIFEGLFLSTDPEYVAGLSRSFSLPGHSSLEGGYYYFQNPQKELTTGRNGGVASLTYRLNRGDKGKFLAETGLSHGGLAIAARGNYDDKKDRIVGSFRVVPQRFAALALSNLRGTFADVNASRDFNSRFFASASLTQSGFNLPILKQNIFNLNTNFSYKLNRNFTLLSGTSYSRFQSKLPVSPAVTSVNLPAGIDFSLSHFGTGFQYQRTNNFDGSGGNDYSVNVRGNAGHFLASAFFRHDVQVPTVAAIFAQVPELADLLERAGIVATNPSDLAQFLGNTALLAELGFSAPITINLAPTRNDTNLSLSWMGAGTRRPQVNLSYFDSNTDLVQGRSQFSSTTVSYSQKVGTRDDLVTSLSLLHTQNGAATSDLKPQFSISMRHRFSSAPTFLLPGRHGTIQGHAFRDDEALAQYKGQAPMAGVVVRLDDDRTTTTDAAGYYAFRHVPFGVHRVEAKLESGEQFHTTDSPAAAEMNSTVDFGISFVKGELFGFVLNDAGAGVAGVTVSLEGDGRSRTFTTTMDGKFLFRGLSPGAYVVSTQPATYPPGYVIQTLQSQSAEVETGQPQKVEISVKAIRSLSGKVTTYDTSKLQSVPLANVTVILKELKLETKTNNNGIYLFRNLPAGTYTVTATYGQSEATRKVTIPPEPTNLRDIDLDVTAK